MPERIQRRRTAGWRMPDGAVYVGRPTRFGNPFRASFENGRWLVVDDNGVDYQPLGNSATAARQRAVDLFAELEVAHGLLAARGADITALTGRDLVCWCPLEQPCHADALLDLANQSNIIEGEQA